MSTLVIGAGLIGGLSAQALLDEGERVVLVDLRKPEALAAGAGSLITEACDVTDIEALRDIIARHHIRRVLHTAALLSTAIRVDPLAGIRVNIMGTAHVLECARQLGLERVVCASSTTVAYNTFGSQGPQALQEDLPMRLISEQPASLYAVTKLTGEHLAGLYHQLYGVDVISLRYGAVLGGRRDSPTSVPGRLMHQLAQAGREGREYTLDDPFMIWGGREEFVDARDCARANVLALRVRPPTQRVFNIATGQWFSMAEFAQAMRAVLPGLRVRLPEPPNTGFAGFAHRRPAPSDIAAAQAQLGFRSRHDLEDSFRHWCIDPA